MPRKAQMITISGPALAGYHFDKTPILIYPRYTESQDVRLDITWLQQRLAHSMAKAASQPTAQPTEADDSDNADNSPADPGSLSTTHRRTLVFTLCMAVYLSAFDITIIATALPTISRRRLDAIAAEYVWIASSYTLASTSLTPVWGKASEI